MTIEDVPLKERMKLKGFYVTNKKFGNTDNLNRMIIDNQGNEIGYKTPSECFTFIKTQE